MEEEACDGSLLMNSGTAFQQTSIKGSMALHTDAAMVDKTLLDSLSVISSLDR